VLFIGTQFGILYTLTPTSAKSAISAERLSTWAFSPSHDDVFWSVILATLKSSNNRALCTAYDQILDDLDDDKDLTFAHIQTVCASQFRQTKERHPEPSHCADTPRATPRTPDNKYKLDACCTQYKHQ
jgi:hypothetical protein